MEKTALFIEKNEKKNTNRIARNNGTPPMTQGNGPEQGNTDRQTAMGRHVMHRYDEELHKNE